MKKPKIGENLRGKRIKAIRRLSNGWYVVKTDNKFSKRDFKVKTIFSTKPLRYMTSKHAHFAIDLYGKICSDKKRSKLVLKAIVDVWHREKIKAVLEKYQNRVTGLPGYSLEYILSALEWILQQEDINFKGRSDRKQKELDEICGVQNVIVPKRRKGSQLAIALLCDIVNGTHPVKALRNANLRI